MVLREVYSVWTSAHPKVPRVMKNLLELSLFLELLLAVLRFLLREHEVIYGTCLLQNLVTISRIEILTSIAYSVIFLDVLLRFVTHITT